MYIDSHTHFDITLEDENISENIIFEEMKKNSIKHAVQVSIDIESAKWSLNFTKRHMHEGILFTIGIHPSSRADDHELNRFNEFLSDIVNSEDSSLLLGIGECGLDFYRMRQNKNVQIRSFEYQIDLANRYGLPIIVHSRDAMDDTIQILKDKSHTSGIIHCFPGDRKAAKKALDLGFYISFAGNVTYKKALDLHDSASYVPMDRMLLETDSPFLTPAPLRGKKNRPYYIVNTYKFISELRKEPLQKIIDSVYENFKRLKRRRCA